MKYEQMNLNDEFDTRVVLMSMRNEYFEQILNGSKHYEYRKKYINSKSLAYVYISKTKKEISGIIYFDKPIYATSHEIAMIAEKDAPGSYESILEYFDKGYGYALPIKSVVTTKSIPLNKIKEKFPSFSPPQSYYYLDKKPLLLEYIKNNK